MAPSTDEATVKKLTEELKNAAVHGKPSVGIIEVLKRIKDEVVWTTSMSETEGGRALEGALYRCSASLERREDKDLQASVAAVFDAKNLELRDEEIREVEARWWDTAPLSQDADSEHIELEFRDVTSQHKSYPVTEVWPPETVECAPSEPFENAAQRFRVQANKKHRHPFWPSRHFDAILGTERASMDTLGTRTVADVLGDLSEDRVVEYVRNDEDNQMEFQRSPARHFSFWDRTLPEWCMTPDHWVEPVPPPRFLEQLNAPRAPNEPYYKKVPTLHVTGRGRRIVPSATKPELIARSLFVPVQDGPAHTMNAVVDPAGDLVPRSAQLTPDKITIDEARAMLGRVVQSSTEPRSDPDAPPAGKRRKVNYEAYTLGFAWGLELDANGGPAWLHCVKWEGGGTIEYVLDLSGQNRRAYSEDADSPLALWVIPCAWVGIAVLPMDQKGISGETEKTVEGAGDKAAPRVGEAEKQKPAMSFEEWSSRTDKWIRNLNKKKFAPVVEVGVDGTFVGGDLGMSKGDEDEFEAEITGAKPGIWLMSIEPAETEDGGEDEDDLMGATPKIIRFVWKSDGSVNYGALPRASVFQRTAAADPDDDAEWEVVGTFSVDSGTPCLFSKYALDELLAAGEDREAMLESLMDMDEGDKVFVPAGIVVVGNDGGYEIEGTRDAEGRIIALRLRL
ncbi:hypothetical protein GSI_05256 [Ganoderma sinense ZZ0214-1]|uniref:Uncharacterized protein n=1 Tax=Ganoderma sinense ZZ0214-1 TaxID=1077348 RepID=A0A2G8SFM7_9APHY|nr:hypothetical protein GSI_05256 [Ganoderma sinense ZZ0214-1]